MGVPAGAGVSASGRSPYFPDDDANGVVQGTLNALGPTAPFAVYGPMNLFIWTEFTTELTTADGSFTATVAAAGAIAAGASISSTLVPAGTVATALAGTDITLRPPPRTVWGTVKAGSTDITGMANTDFLTGAVVVSDYIPAGAVVSSILVEAQEQSSTNPAVLGSVRLDQAATSDPGTVEHVPVVFLIADDAIATGADATAFFTSAAIGLTGVVQLERSFNGGLTWVVCNVGGSGGLAQWNTTTPVSLSFGEPELEVLYRLNVISQSAVAGNSLNFRISATGQRATTLSVQTL